MAAPDAWRSPLATWGLDGRVAARFGRGRAPVVRRPRDAGWRRLAPDFAAARRLAAAGLPFHVVTDRAVDRRADPRQLGLALAAGATVYYPQVHQVLPRLARLMSALRAACFGAGRAECAFLFLVDGRGRPGLGLHHDGALDGVWLQLEGRRTVTVGPPVARGTPEDLDERRVPAAPRAAARAGWRTLALGPGTLFHLPPYTPHRVVCHGRSLAITLTWGRRRGASPVDWDVVSGWADAVPAASRTRLWTQVPVAAGPIDARRGDFPLWTPAGVLRLPAGAHAIGRRLATMPEGPAARLPAAVRRLLLDHGILAPRDLPRWLRPAHPAALDGWRFA